MDESVKELNKKICIGFLKKGCFCLSQHLWSQECLANDKPSPKCCVHRIFCYLEFVPPMGIAENVKALKTRVCIGYYEQSCFFVALILSHEKEYLANHTPSPEKLC
ncbi:hypothetical protein AVEN_175325-1 [Araneus ventricosus]|uniref:Uncharacterized protein n=1 Tax=Araneus ventricosus TaxID=182803 RepID=A0A4Y2AIZ2_ARAVE|nr:hypothetical protein AVEN_246397-1 [Araneus ventricosus]GBL79772.1 hypothetical protein AVEN_248128-1 [Araneus ventricosus]GBL79794.1 hypothetical protein AVEN_110429-1 [Araneus ventricosus]GBL79803.1 hypothetical protein AVEN_113596-1 [Araneus ventricosus]GBO40919.1 hypothetical protein AVEN_175325-1 [Araneus ventricosus]